jgi:hypothetical protein
MYPAIHLCFSFCFAVFCLSAEKMYSCIPRHFFGLRMDEIAKFQHFIFARKLQHTMFEIKLYMFQCSIWGLGPIEIHLYKSILCHMRTVSKMESVVCFIQVIGLKRVKSFHRHHSSLQKGQRATLEPDILSQFVLRG